MSIELSVIYRSFWLLDRCCRTISKSMSIATFTLTMEPESVASVYVYLVVVTRARGNEARLGLKVYLVPYLELLYPDHAGP